MSAMVEAHAGGQSASFRTDPNGQPLRLHLRPPFGVLYAIDGVDSGKASTGLRIVLDGKAHQLVFTCMNDACEPVTKAVEAGDTPEQSIDVVGWASPKVELQATISAGQR